MCGWMDRWLDGWMVEWLNGWMDGWLDEKLKTCAGGWFCLGVCAFLSANVLLRKRFFTIKYWVFISECNIIKMNGKT